MVLSVSVTIYFLTRLRKDRAKTSTWHNMLFKFFLIIRKVREVTNKLSAWVLGKFLLRPSPSPDPQLEYWKKLPISKDFWILDFFRCELF
jgi:hypothetical protein